MNLLFNMADLKQLLMDYYHLTQMRIGVFDNHFTEITSYPTRLSNYCQLLREDDEMKDKCMACDHNAFKKCRESGQLYLYHCHAGLIEAIVPIKNEDAIIGYIMLGQVLNTTSKTYLWNTLIPNLKSYNVNMDALKEAFDIKNNVPKETLESSARMLEICANYLYSNQLLMIERDTLAHKIDQYIGEHLQDDLSATVICDAFSLGKTKLYEIANENYGMGVAKHICQIRVQRAKEHLINSDLAVYEIADLVGIYDYNYFTKVFKKETGVTPKGFRKEYQMR